MLTIRFFQNPPGDRSIPARDLAAALLGRDPGPLALSAFGKPALPFPGLHFSKSDSGPLTLFVLSDRPCGADLQRIVPLKEEGLSLARRFFRPEEAAALEAMGEGEAREAFFRFWVRKEAYLKYTGRGLSAGLSAFALEERAPGVFSVLPGPGLPPALVLDLPAPEGYLAALCLPPEGDPSPISMDPCSPSA